MFPNFCLGMFFRVMKSGRRQYPHHKKKNILPARPAAAPPPPCIFSSFLCSRIGGSSPPSLVHLINSRQRTDSHHGGTSPSHPRADGPAPQGPAITWHIHRRRGTQDRREETPCRVRPPASRGCRPPLRLPPLH